MTGAAGLLGALAALLLAVPAPVDATAEPLVTPSAAVPDQLVPDAGSTGSADVPVATPRDLPPRATPAQAGTPAATGEPAPRPDRAVPSGGGATETGVGDSPVGRVVGGLVVAVAAIATALAFVALHERLAPPRAGGPFPAGRSGGAAGLRGGAAGRAGGPAAPARVLTSPGTTRPPAGAVPELAADGVAVLPVLARPSAAGAGWAALHDVVDTWAWHEYWLPTGRAAAAVLPVDGLVLGELVSLPGAPAGDLVAPVPGADPVVLPVSAGVILARPAAADTGDLAARLVLEARALRAAARLRTGAALAFVHFLTAPFSVLVLPAAALAVRAPVAVLVTSLVPGGVALVTAALRWAALDDADRATTLRLPVHRGWLLVVTGPGHAILRCRAAWAALRAAPPVPLARRVATSIPASAGRARAGASGGPGRPVVPWGSAGRT
jgi:hypothetical protein